VAKTARPPRTEVALSAADIVVGCVVVCFGLGVELRRYRVGRWRLWFKDGRCLVIGASVMFVLDERGMERRLDE